MIARKTMRQTKMTISSSKTKQKKPKVAEKHAIKEADASKNATTMMVETRTTTRPIKINKSTSKSSHLRLIRKRKTPLLTTTKTTRSSITAATVVVEEAVAVVVSVVSVVAKTCEEAAVVVNEEVDEAEVQQGDTTMTSMCSQASVPEIS